MAPCQHNPPNRPGEPRLAMAGSADAWQKRSGSAKPQQAQVSSGPTLLNALGLGGDANVNAVGGAVGGLLTGGLTASDRRQARQNAVGRMRGTATDPAREVARIRGNPSLSIEEKRTRIACPHAQWREVTQENRDYLSGL